MAASVGPDSGHYIGQQVLIDRFLCSRQCRVNVLLLSGPDHVVAQLERWMKYWLARRLTSAP
jgi:hypothetical protein